MYTIKVKAKLEAGITSVKLSLTPAPRSAQDADEGDIPAVFLQEVRVQYAGRDVFVGNLGTAISVNPYLGFRFAGGEKGQRLMIDWTDNQGNRGTEQTAIK